VTARTAAPTPTAHGDGRRLDDLVDVPFRRLEGEDAWSTGIALAELPAVDRLLVVEEDDTPFDPASPQPTAPASRVAYAEAIDRPFPMVPIDDGIPGSPGPVR
jgi:hypothetical protein